MLTLTSFKPGERPTGRAKGTKNKSTVLKQTIGINTWQQLEAYLITEGAARLIQSLEELDSVQYVKAYVALMEYFKPKLARHGHIFTGNNIEPVEITLNLEG